MGWIVADMLLPHNARMQQCCQNDIEEPKNELGN